LHANRPNILAMLREGIHPLDLPGVGFGEGRGLFSFKFDCPVLDSNQELSRPGRTRSSEIIPKLESELQRISVQTCKRKKNE